MRWLLVTDTFPPSTKAGALLMHSLAVALAGKGHSVAVVTPDPGAVEGRLDEHCEGFRVLRVPSGPLKDISYARRAFNELRLSWLLKKGYLSSALAAERFDGIAWYSPSIFLAPFAGFLKRRLRCRAYLILRDIFPQWAVDTGILRKGPAYLLFKQFENYQYRVADVIGVQSPGNLAYFSRRPSLGRLEVLYNWTSITNDPPVDGDPLAPYGLSGKKVFVYGGTMGVAQDMDNLLRLAGNLRHRDDIRFLFLGTGSEVPRIKRTIAETGLTHLVIADGVEPAKFRVIAKSCRAGLVSLDHRHRTHNVPGKFIAYLEAGIPVIASLNPDNDLKAVLEKSGAGYASWNGDDEALAEDVKRLADDDALRRTMADQSKMLARSLFSIEYAVQQIVSGLA